MGDMANIVLGSGRQIEISPDSDLRLNLAPNDLQDVAQWAVSLINSKSEVPGFRNFGNDKIVVDNAQPEYIDVDQSNSSFRYGDYLIKIRKTLDLSNRNNKIISTLAKAKFENTPQYFGHIEIEVFGKSVEFITIYEFIEESEDGWTWAPKKLINNDLNFTNEIASICASMHRDLKSMACDKTLDFMQVTEEIKTQIPNSFNLDSNYDFTGYPDPKQMFEIWNSKSRQYFSNLEAKKSSFSFSQTNNQMTHGDFHVGQILKSGSKYFVIDFDGSPVLQAEMKNSWAPRESDVAHFSNFNFLSGKSGRKIKQD
jgi:maltokinase